MYAVQPIGNCVLKYNRQFIYCQNENKMCLNSIFNGLLGSKSATEKTETGSKGVLKVNTTLQYIQKTGVNTISKFVGSCQ